MYEKRAVFLAPDRKIIHIFVKIDKSVDQGMGIRDWGSETKLDLQN
jgi:hypothetical protein